MKIYISSPIATFTEYYSWCGIQIDTQRLASLDILNRIGELVDPTDEAAAVSIFEEWSVTFRVHPLKQLTDNGIDESTLHAISDAASTLAASYIAVVRSFQSDLAHLTMELSHKHGIPADMGGSKKSDSRILIGNSDLVVVIPSALTVASGRIPLEIGAAKAARKPVAFLSTPESSRSQIVEFRLENVLEVPSIRDAASEIAKLTDGGASEGVG